MSCLSDPERRRVVERGGQALTVLRAYKAPRRGFELPVRIRQQVRFAPTPSHVPGRCSALPRERFSAMTRSGRSQRTSGCPLCGGKPDKHPLSEEARVAHSGPENFFRFHNQQRIAPIAEPSTCQNPKAPIGVARASPRGFHTARVINGRWCVKTSGTRFRLGKFSGTNW